MRTRVWKAFMAGMMLLCVFSSPAAGVDVELSKDSTLEGILSRGVLRIGLEVGYMPFEMVDMRSGVRQRSLRHGTLRTSSRKVNLMGFDIDMGIAMAKELGVKVEFVDTRWSSIIPALKLGRFDVIFGGMSVTEERKQEVDFAEPFMTIGQTVLVKKAHQGTVQTYTDLNDPKYAVVSQPSTTGEAAVQEHLPKAEYRPMPTAMQGARAVLQGEADAFVYDLPFNAIFHSMYGKDALIFLDEPFTKEPLAWAVRKNDQDFLDFLNGFLQQIKQDGRFERMYTKWFESTDWFRFARQDLG